MNVVADYREKILAVYRQAAWLRRNNITPHVIVPAASLVDGVLVEQVIREVDGAGVHNVSLPDDAQVRETGWA